jgi:hypothetical protein
MFLGLLGAGLMAMAMLPFVVLVWAGGALLHALRAPGWR